MNKTAAVHAIHTTSTGNRRRAAAFLLAVMLHLVVSSVLPVGYAYAGNGISLDSTAPVTVGLMNSGVPIARSEGPALLYWDGAQTTGNGQADGGAGVWNTTNTNWTGTAGPSGEPDFNVNSAWPGSNTSGVFQGQGGVVTVEGVQQFNGLFFESDGYSLEGGGLEIAPPQGGGAVPEEPGGGTFIKVAADKSASIDSRITGSNKSLEKIGAGILLLGNAANAYDGGTKIKEGVLSLGGQGAAGSGGISVESGATLETTYGGALANAVSGEGSLVKKGSGKLSLTGANDYSGKTEIRQGTLTGGAENSLSANSKHELLGGNLVLEAADQSIGGLAGAEGIVDLGSAKLTVSQKENSAFSGQLKGESASGLALRGAGELSLSDVGGYQGGFDIAQGSVLELVGSSILSVNNSLMGDGVLALKAGGETERIAFGAGTGQEFAGAVEARRGSLALDEQAEKALAKAELRLGSEASAQVDADRSLGSLTLDGGKLAYSFKDGKPAGKLSVTDLALTDKGGRVMLDLPADTGNSSAGEDKNFYDFAGQSAQTALILASGTVTGSQASLELVDKDGKLISDSQERRIMQNGAAVGKAHFDFTTELVKSGDAKGLYYGYGLKEMESYANQSVVLNSDDAESAKPKLDARLTGDGGYTFTGRKEAEVGNSRSNYTGPTSVDGANLLVIDDNAFGRTSLLSVTNKGSVDFNGYAQTVGMLSGSSNARISLGSASGESGSFTVDQNEDSTFSGSISGKGRLIKSGSGMLTLAGTNSYSGDTDVRGGMLMVSGSIESGRVTVRDRASLGLSGGGTIGKDVHVYRGGTLLAGNGGVIGGDLTMASGSVLTALDGNRALNVDGTVNLSSGVQVQLSGTNWSEGSYELLAAANSADLNGFSTLYVPGITEEYSVSNDRGRLVLQYRSKSRPGGLSSNQSRVYQAVTSLDKSGPLYTALSAGMGADMGRSLDMLSGEAHSSLHGNLALLDQSFARKLSTHISRISLQRRPIVVDESTYMDPGDYDRFSTYSGTYYGTYYNIWGSAGGSHSSVDGSGSAAKSTLQGPEVAVGLDALFSSGVMAGLAFQYSYKDFEVDSRDSEADINSFSGALYGGREINFEKGVLRMILGGIYSHHDVSTSRELRAAAVREDLDADYSADSVRIFAEGAFSMVLADKFHMEPFVNLGWNWVRTDKFSESKGVGSLSGKAENSDNISTLLGMRFDLPLHEMFDLTASVGWQHNYGSDRPELTMSFREGSDSFTIKGNRLSRDELILGLGAGVNFTESVSLNVNYDGGVGADSQTHGGAATLIYRW